jgi:hypothetical protein
MVDIVGIIGPGGEGGTFLDWTLHYLAGDAYVKYIHLDRVNKVVLGLGDQRVVSNPIKHDGTAHNHYKAHPTEQLIGLCVSEYLKINNPTSSLHTMYVVPSIESYENGRSYTDIARGISASHPEIRLIHFVHSELVLEELAQRIKTRISNNTEDIEDIRDRVRANCDDNNKVIHSPDVYALSMASMFYNLDTEIHNIFRWLKLSIKQDKYEKWVAIYEQWQRAQNFCTSISI